MNFLTLCSTEALIEVVSGAACTKAQVSYGSGRSSRPINFCNKFVAHSLTTAVSWFVLHLTMQRYLAVAKESELVHLS